jgi:hypothetical protein
MRIGRSLTLSNVLSRTFDIPFKKVHLSSQYATCFPSAAVTTLNGVSMNAAMICTITQIVAGRVVA